MERFYSDTLVEGIRLLYFQADPAKFSQGVKLVEQAVEAGEPDAYYFLARCYAWEDGGVKEDMKKARELSKQGIEQGSDLCVLGADRMFQLNGDVRAAMKRPLKHSFEAVLKMAGAGEPMAQYAVGLFYFWGDMLAQLQNPNENNIERLKKENAAEALKWFRLSAVQGCIPAFRNAFNGVRGGLNNMEKDPREALRWMETVKDKLDLREYYVSIIVEYQGLKDFDNAIRWCRTGTEAGDGASTVHLGVAYLYGDRGLPADTKEALRLFEVGASLGNAYGYYNMGRCYYYQWGCTRDYKKAFQSFEQAWRLGHPTAEMYLARCYYWGRGVETNEAEAFRIAHKMEQNKEGCPEEILGLCYLYGKGTRPDYARAKELLERTANDYSASCLGLGEIYDKGLGVAEDAAKAASYYETAKSRGNAEAAERMKHFKKTLFGKWKRR